MINWLEDWYLSMCNDDSEHSYGINIKNYGSMLNSVGS